MHHDTFGKPLISFWVHGFSIMFLCCLPAYSAESIDGFRDLKFGMTPQDVHALPNCSTSDECMYELSNKNRYVRLTYAVDGTAPTSEVTQLSKITIDMGQYSEEWYNQLQMILRKSYRLTHDFTDETMNAFLAKQSQELQAGYEDGQVILQVVRRPFGNMILKVVYQNTTLAGEFNQQATEMPLPHTP